MQVRRPNLVERLKSSAHACTLPLLRFSGPWLVPSVPVAISENSVIAKRCRSSARTVHRPQRHAAPRVMCTSRVSSPSSFPKRNQALAAHRDGSLVGSKSQCFFNERVHVAVEEGAPLISSLSRWKRRLRWSDLCSLKNICATFHIVS